MDPKQYRKQITSQLKQHATRKGKAGAFRNPKASDAERFVALKTLGVLQHSDDTDAALELAGSASASPQLRGAAIKSLGTSLNRSPAAVDVLLRLLADDAEPVPVRSAALGALKVAAFHVQSFFERRPAYIAALRKASRSTDPDLRRRSLAVLAREKDAPTQKRLIAGLEDPTQAQLSPEKALLFLSYDLKLDLHDLLLRIVKAPPSDAARLQALRLLSAEASSKALFEKLLKNKKESSEARLIAVAALHALDPAKLSKLGAKIVADESEDDDVREACMVAATTFDKSSTEPLRASALEMQKNAGTPSARRAAKRYLAKRGS
jgi:hypothetical protein